MKMKYRIEYRDRRCCDFANSRSELLTLLKHMENEEIADIRKVYKSGVTDSVKERYSKYITIC